LCYGNPAREDDGLGPELARRLEELSLDHVNVESNYQLLVEDAAIIAESQLVIFVDASLSGEEPFSFSQVAERTDGGYMSHSIDPGPLLALTRETFGRCPPAYALAIRGYSFEMFKEGLTDRASSNLARALSYLTAFLRSEKADQHHTLRHSTTGAGERASGGWK
jgi:hydrogenase maturation protease